MCNATTHLIVHNARLDTVYSLSLVNVSQYQSAHYDTFTQLTLHRASAALHIVCSVSTKYHAWLVRLVTLS